MDLDDIRMEMEKIGGINKINDTVAKKILELCLAHDKSAEELCETWIAFVSRNGSSQDPSIELLNQMEREDFNRKTLQSARNVKSRNHHTERNLPSTPLNKSVNSSSHDLLSQTASPLRVPKSSPSFQLRSKRGEIISSFGSTVSNWISSSLNSSIECKLHVGCTLEEPYNFMSSKPKDRCIILSDLIDDISKEIAMANNIEEWDSINVPKSDELNVVGRIGCDSEGKLNTSSLLLEGSRSTSSGATVPLDVSCLTIYSIFPGQVIAGKALNPSGKKLVLKSLYSMGSLLPFSDLNIDFGAEPLNIIVASGPFTPSDSIDYEPLRDLGEYICKHKPDICILVGPFVESKPTTIAEIDNISFQKLLEDKLDKISEITKDVKTKYVLVASQKDLNCHCVYPTPPLTLNKRNVKHYKNFLCVPDPAILDIGGVVIALTSTDVLLHLAKEEISFPPQQERLARLSGHILNQRSFYPIYPPTSNDMCFDHEGYELHARLPLTPHILILPSDLKYFIKDINGCICINPEHLARGTGGGYFTRIRVAPTMEQSSLKSISKQITAEIIRI